MDGMGVGDGDGGGLRHSVDTFDLVMCLRSSQKYA